MQHSTKDSAHRQPPNGGQEGPQDATRHQPARAGGAATQYRCLIVSVSSDRREMLLRAAAEGGWQTLVAPNIDSARKQLARMMFQLAIVDLEHTPHGNAEEFREVLEDLAGMAEMLLVVCGNEGEPLEEIWARQLGVWLYLPGITSGEEVTLLCGEARQITEQLHATREFHGPHTAVGSSHGG